MNWYAVTTAASERWRAAQEAYWEAVHEARWAHPGTIQVPDLATARAEYRRFILGWYRKLLLPMKPGECVPDEVATLLAEEWEAGESP